MRWNVSAFAKPGATVSALHISDWLGLLPVTMQPKPDGSLARVQFIPVPEGNGSVSVIPETEVAPLLIKLTTNPIPLGLLAETLELSGVL